MRACLLASLRHGLDDGPRVALQGGSKVRHVDDQLRVRFALAAGRQRLPALNRTALHLALENMTHVNQVGDTICAKVEMEEILFMASIK
jgi:hypothetical protein